MEKCRRESERRKEQKMKTMNISNGLNVNTDFLDMQREDMQDTEETKSKRNGNIEYLCEKDEILRSLQIIDVEGTYMKRKEEFT